MSTPPIRIMPRDLAMKIAAGEVIDRPSAVVKELIDNAIDAGACTVSIEVREAGLALIRVSDDGHGIRRSDVALAFTSHATSKISSVDDLEHIGTLGFRGEALPSIAAVARVEVQTRARGEDLGTRFLVEHGNVLAEGTASATIGVRISVSDLFGNVPARRKFVRSSRAESGHIQQVVVHYALAQPGIRFVLTIDGRLSFESPGSGRLSDALVAVYGPSTLETVVPIHRNEVDISIEGMISTPALTRQNRTAITFAVNGRPVQNRSLAFALEEAYSGFIMTGRHPLGSVHIAVPPSTVDVNIHPSKADVRFVQERAVHGALYRAVEQALLALHMARRNLSTDFPTILTTVPASEPQPLLPASTERSPEQPPVPLLPALRVFGQANQMFIIAEGPDGLYMIDQHAAHERIIFDTLDEQLSQRTLHMQPLLEPTALDLSPEQMTALEENREMLRDVGFHLEPFGHSACLIRSVPVLARGGEPAELVAEVLTELQSAPQPAVARERALAMMACKAAVKAGQSLDVEEMREIVHQLERTPRPSTCPHGRPTMIHLSHSQLEREFGR